MVAPVSGLACVYSHHCTGVSGVCNNGNCSTMWSNLGNFDSPQLSPKRWTKKFGGLLMTSGCGCQKSMVVKIACYTGLRLSAAGTGGCGRGHCLRACLLSVFWRLMDVTRSIILTIHNYADSCVSIVPRSVICLIVSLQTEVRDGERRAPGRGLS